MNVMIYLLIGMALSAVIGMLLRGRWLLVGTVGVLGLTSFLSVSCSGAQATVESEMTGKWKGEGRIVVSWCKQKRLALDLEIGEDGSVEGRVGDAKLVEGQLQQNRGAIGRGLNIKTDYIIVGKLEGEIVAGEHLVRSEVKIPLNFHGDTYSGGLHTDGSKAENPSTGMLSVGDLDLKRQ